MSAAWTFLDCFKLNALKHRMLKAMKSKCVGHGSEFQLVANEALRTTIAIWPVVSLKGSMSRMDERVYTASKG